MTLVIADTSPLQYLHQAGVIDLLPSLFTTVQVPAAVCDELQIGRERGFDVPDPNAFPWMQIRATTRSTKLDPFELGAGEHAALSLALETGECLVLLDDGAARAAAKTLALVTTGTLGILLLAKERTLITALAPLLATLEQRGFRITDQVRTHVLKLAGE
ncbi:DUF3368 domain-containing protein [soil metagenome]